MFAFAFAFLSTTYELVPDHPEERPPERADDERPGEDDKPRKYRLSKGERARARGEGRRGADGGHVKRGVRGTVRGGQVQRGVRWDSFDGASKGEIGREGAGGMWSEECVAKWRGGHVS